MAKKALRILFIGNSHTYYHDLPQLVKTRAAEAGYDCGVTMLAHPGWYLEQHVQEPEVRFNILYGGYDYVVLQEHAHPFGPEEKYREAVAALNQIIRAAGSVPVLYEVWAKKTEPELQASMNEVHRRAAEETGALLAPVGERWWDFQKHRPELELYAEDGAHASKAGSDLAAEYIWETIRTDLRSGQKTLQA